MLCRRVLIGVMSTRNHAQYGTWSRGYVYYCRIKAAANDVRYLKTACILALFWRGARSLTVLSFPRRLSNTNRAIARCGFLSLYFKLKYRALGQL